ncbi:bifunctional transcriptional activator/DNA repair enzyme AdaA [candidate division KSB1 bacterium]
MKIENYTTAAEDYHRIGKAITYIENNFREQPSLNEIAEHVNLSEYHFQRLFKRWAGISPKKFLQYLTIEYSKKLLEESKSLLDISFETGLSSTARLHDLFITYEGMTPGTYKEKGSGITITWGIHPTFFGDCFIASTELGVCGLFFIEGDNLEYEMNRLRKTWENAVFINDPAVTAPLIDRIFNGLLRKEENEIRLILKGTQFQLKVWEALIRIPFGSLVTYSLIAEMIGSPGAVRAVGSANANNPIGILIPCHRVIRNSGVIGGYRWSPVRKRAIIAWENALVSNLSGDME